MTDTDKIFMEELKLEFMESTSMNIVEMTNLFNEGKFAEIARIAHDIKGTSGIFGLDEGSEIAKELQYAAQGNETNRIKELIDHLADYMRRNNIIK